MCTEGVGHLVMADETIQDLMANPILDFVHKQVVMTLYSLDANKKLTSIRKMLPIYLGMDWEKCKSILDTIEQAGIIKQIDGGILLCHKLTIEDTHSCGCS
jgi:hypothetical protein